MKFQVRQKSSFFDRDRVIRAIGKKTAKTLSRFGAFVRQRSITLQLGHRVKKGFGVESKVSNREGVSAPGQPPFPHTGDLVKRIAFAYDFQAKTVVIGPTYLNKTFITGSGQPEKGTVPRVLELGGRIGILEAYRGGAWGRISLRSKKRLPAWLPVRTRTVTIAPRPFMRPAFETELKRLPPQWRQSA